MENTIMHVDNKTNNNLVFGPTYILDLTKNMVSGGVVSFEEYFNFSSLLKNNLEAFLESYAEENEIFFSEKHSEIFAKNLLLEVSFYVYEMLTYEEIITLIKNSNERMITNLLDQSKKYMSKRITGIYGELTSAKKRAEKFKIKELNEIFEDELRLFNTYYRINQMDSYDEYENAEIATNSIIYRPGFNNFEYFPIKPIEWEEDFNLIFIRNLYEAISIISEVEILEMFDFEDLKKLLISYEPLKFRGSYVDSTINVTCLTLTQKILCVNYQKEDKKSINLSLENMKRAFVDIVTSIKEGNALKKANELFNEFTNTTFYNSLSEDAKHTIISYKKQFISEIVNFNYKGNDDKLFSCFIRVT